MAANNKENAVKELIEFIDSDLEKVVLIKGTHQFAKHSLVLDMIIKFNFFKKGVFKSNGLKEIPDHFERAGYMGFGVHPSAGREYIVNGTSFYFDSYGNTSTWSKTPLDLDFALIYPMDSFCESKKEHKIELLDDVLKWKNIKKVFFVTCTDIRHDYTWLNEYVDRTVIYDVEEEDPDYHQRVLNFKNK